MNGDAEAKSHRGGEKCQSRSLEDLIKIAELLSQQALRNAGRPKCPVPDNVLARMLAQERDDPGVHHLLHLERNTRKHKEPSILPVKAEPRCRTDRVGKCRRITGNHCLRLRRVGPREVALIEYEGNLLPHVRIGDEIGTEKPAHGRFRDVVVRRAQTPRDNDGAGAFPRARERRQDGFGIIADGGHFRDVDADLVQPIGDSGLVGVDDLPDQQLVANRDDVCVHHAESAPWKSG